MLSIVLSFLIILDRRHRLGCFLPLVSNLSGRLDCFLQARNVHCSAYGQKSLFGFQPNSPSYDSHTVTKT